MVWYVMEKGKCKRCKKVIEGFSQRHVDTLMAQHMIKHNNDDKENIHVVGLQ